MTDLLRYLSMTLLVLFVLPPLLGETAPVESALDRGDQAYERRAEGRDGLRAGVGPISAAIAAFEEALAENPNDQHARSRLLRALFFKGDYALTEHAARLDIFERGQKLGEEGIDQLVAGTPFDRRGGEDFDRLVEHLDQQPDATGIYYWTAVHWGLWGRERGKIAAARQGVAGKIRDYALIVNAVDSDFEGGSGHRMLGRLHAEAPKIPFVTGWIDRDLAVSELETATGLSDDSLTLLYFVEALLDFAPSRRHEAMELLEEVAARSGDRYNGIEEQRAISDAQTLLRSLGG